MTPWLNYHHLLYFWTVVREGGVTKAAEALRLDAPNLLKLGVVDGVVKEPLGGAQEDPAATGSAIRKTLRDSLADLSKASPEKLIAMRYAKFRAMGVFSE